MVKVKIGDSTTRETVMLENNTTLRNALEENNIHYETGITYLDGLPIVHGDFDKTFAELGKTEKCSLIVVVKTENA